MHGADGTVFRRRHGDSYLATLLSLELLLLAFFVLLTALSRFEGDRSRLVIDGVQAAFGGSIAGLTGPAAMAPSDAAVVQALQSKIGLVVKSAIPLTRVELAAPAGPMRLDLPTETFFRPGEARLSPVRASLFRRLVAALAGRPAGYRYEVDILQAGGPPRALAVARAGALARAMVAAGAPPESLSVGLRGDGGFDGIRFVIRLRAGRDPARLFDDLAGGP